MNFFLLRFYICSVSSIHVFFFIMLAVKFVWASFLTLFYTYERKVNVFTDDWPLVSICQKPLSNVSKLLKNLHQRAQQYDFSIKCKEPIDALSQVPTGKTKVAELMIGNNLMMHPITVGSQRLDPRHWTTLS